MRVNVDATSAKIAALRKQVAQLKQQLVLARGGTAAAGPRVLSSTTVAAMESLKTAAVTATGATPGTTDATVLATGECLHW